MQLHRAAAWRAIRLLGVPPETQHERETERHRGNESLSLLSVITWVESYYRNQNTDQWPRKTADFSLSLVLHTQWKCFTQAHSFEGGGDSFNDY